MKNINKVHAEVERILRKYPETRNSDDVLYARLCIVTNPIICASMSFEDVFRNRKAYGFPKYSSVSRARRKVQADFPELKAVEEVVEERYENFKAVRSYATQ